MRAAGVSESDARPDHRHGLLRRAGITLIGGALGAGVAILNEVLCARYLGIHAYGMYALALVMARIAEIVSIMGLPVAALHHIPLYRDRGEHDHVHGTIWAAGIPPLVNGLILAALLWWLAPRLATDVFDSPASESYIRVMAMAIPWMAMSELLGTLTRAFGHAAYYVVVRNLVPPLLFLGSLTLIIAVQGDRLWVGRAFGAAYLAATLVGLACVWKIGGPRVFGVRPRFELRALYAYSSPVLVNNVLYLVIACTAIILLGVLRTDREVGVFRACMQIVIPFDMLVMALNAAVGHIYPVLAGRRQHEELAGLVRTVSGRMSVMAVGLFLLVVFNRHDLLWLMGPNFVEGAGVLALLALGQAIQACAGTAGYLLVMGGWQRQETHAAAITAAACIVMNLLLIPAYGAMGAAVATMASGILFSGLRIFRVRKQIGIGIGGSTAVRAIAAGALTALVTVGLTTYLPLGEGNGILVMLIRTAMVGLLFGSLWIGIGLDRAERRALAARIAEYLASTRRPPGT